MPATMVEDGEFKGWMNWPDDPFEGAAAGPFYFKVDEQGARCAFRAEPKHMNGGGFMHGGCLMTFADFALFAIAHEELGSDHSVTVTLTSEFLDSAVVGEMVEARGDVLRAGRSMIFVRGLVTAEGRPVLNFSGTIKRVGKRPESH
ncbi:MAG: PaaI family thioesterase [Pseudomonadota bacterium]